MIETAALMRTAGASETGGVLLGHLRRDPDSGVFAEVTGQAPATLAQSGLTSLGFTPEAWTAIRAEIAGRANNEIWLGWWHSHPVRHWQERKTEEASGTGRFFSVSDCSVHRTVFSAAYNIGLVVSDTPTRHGDWSVGWNVFGWRRGLIVERGFAVTRKNAAVGGRAQEGNSGESI